MKKNKNILLEVCADSVNNAIIAQNAGADRIELCVNLNEDGTTPPYSQIIEARKSLNIKLHILIRPRGGNFVYNDTEFETVINDIHICGKAGCDGIATGILHSDGSIDTGRMKNLVDIAHEYGMSVTFHRAFDRSNDLFKSMEDIIAVHCDRILTSGGCKTALEGASVIKNLIEKSAGRIIIMPGAGITPANAQNLIFQTRAGEIHGTFIDKDTGRTTLNDLFL